MGKKNNKIKDMTAEEMLKGMTGVNVKNLKDGDVLVGDGKGGMINKPLKEVEKDKLQNIIKLNEELTEENSRLLTELDGKIAKLSYMTLKRNEEREDKNYWREKYNSVDKELSSIKSKWWYKLMT